MDRPRLGARRARLFVRLRQCKPGRCVGVWRRRHCTCIALHRLGYSTRLALQQRKVEAHAHASIDYLPRYFYLAHPILPKSLGVLRNISSAPAVGQRPCWLGKWIGRGL
jgi:hypothetical protein